MTTPGSITMTDLLDRLIASPVEDRARVLRESDDGRAAENLAGMIEHAGRMALADATKPVPATRCQGAFPPASCIDPRTPRQSQGTRVARTARRAPTTRPVIPAPSRPPPPTCRVSALRSVPPRVQSFRRPLWGRRDGRTPRRSIGPSFRYRRPRAVAWLRSRCAWNLPASFHRIAPRKRPSP